MLAWLEECPCLDTCTEEWQECLASLQARDICMGAQWQAPCQEWEEECLGCLGWEWEAWEGQCLEALVVPLACLASLQLDLPLLQEQPLSRLKWGLA